MDYAWLPLGQSETPKSKPLSIVTTVAVGMMLMDMQSGSAQSLSLILCCHHVMTIVFLLENANAGISALSQQYSIGGMHVKGVDSSGGISCLECACSMNTSSTGSWNANASAIVVR